MFESEKINGEIIFGQH